ncbi:unnamed protein product, partial [Mesorhabditis belari]|uniref:NAD(P)H-hydrate epimerase n=1 Tax=Mesorhabditis belari TaxID=2138241 RepID=A0AAF3F1R8_9BILA
MTSTIRFLGQNEAIKIDEDLFNRFGFKVEQLMELAGLATAQAVYDWKPEAKKVLLLCGPGNNGGDGFVCARHLQMFGYSPTIVYPKESRNELMKGLVAQCEGMEIPIERQLSQELASFDIVVDALFGFSFKPPIREPFGEIIRKVQASERPIFSIDIPSEVPHFTPKAVISLTAPKLCMQYFKGSHYLGGRFVPRKMIDERELRIPVYTGSNQFVKLQ